MNVHFIMTRGVLTPDGQRAILSARVHGQLIVLWYTTEQKPDVHGLDIQIERIEIPSWVPPNRRDQISDLLAYKILHEHGGLMLQLDTISIRSAWDLLTTQDMVVSTDWPENDPDVLTSPAVLRFKYNVISIAKKGVGITSALYDETKRRILHEPNDEWGYTGPFLICDFVRKYPEQIEGVPFPSLCGWAPGYLWRFYLGLETPKPQVRVIHLCWNFYRSLYERRYADWARENPAYAGEVARRTDANERLLRCP